MSQLEAYIYASGVVLCSAVYTFTHHPYFFGVMHLGMKIRVASCSLLYRFVWGLSSCFTSLQPPEKPWNSQTLLWVRPLWARWWTCSPTMLTGAQCCNASTIDFLCRFDLSVLFNHYLWCGPLQLVIVTGLLYQRIGPSSLVVGFLPPHISNI